MDTGETPTYPEAVYDGVFKYDRIEPVVPDRPGEYRHTVPTHSVEGSTLCGVCETPEGEERTKVYVKRRTFAYRY